MGSFSALPSCFLLHVSLLLLVSTNSGLPRNQVLFAQHPACPTLEEQMLVGWVMEMGPCSSAIPAASIFSKETRTKRKVSSRCTQRKQLCFNVSRTFSAELDYLPPQKNPQSLFFTQNQEIKLRFEKF